MTQLMSDVLGDYENDPEYIAFQITIEATELICKRLIEHGAEPSFPTDLIEKMVLKRILKAKPEKDGER